MHRLWQKSDLIVNESVKLSLYRSHRSRLTVAIGDVPGPMVKGLVSFVTEANTDDGLPHTLEHLVFMGSKKYPFKGVLDIIANRCLASGTNAWTDQDHTAYTLSTVGSEGFFKVLPVYLNHLLSPTLTKCQFMTEVHHINGDGENAGVVYSEMQDHESEMEEMVHHKMQALLYPPRHPYRVDTGGKLKNLRESCSVEKVREFHKQFYHLSNMMVVVCGKVDHERLLDIISQTEEEQLPGIPLDFPRPFQQPIPNMKADMEERIRCPSDDSSRGLVEMAWLGPAATDYYSLSALNVLFDYMENTAVSPLQRDFVLLDEPLASAVLMTMNEQSTCVITLRFQGVPTERLEAVRTKFLEKTLVEHVEEKAFDMERMGYILEQTIQNELVKLETRAHDEIFHHMIGHQLYGEESVDKLTHRLNEVSDLRKMRSEPASFWSGLLKRYLTKPSATVYGAPDEDLVEKVSKAEAERLAKQRGELGDEGLLTCGEVLGDAIKSNTSLKPDSDVLDALIVEKLEHFHTFPVESVTASSPSLTGPQKQLLSQFPFPAVLHDVKDSKFVEMFLLLDTGSLSLEDRAWLMLYTDLMFESPAVVNGELKSAEDVARLYTRDLIEHAIAAGVSGSYDRLITLWLKVDNNKAANAANWAKVFVSGIKMDASRARMSAQKMASEAREKKRDGCHVAACALSYGLYEQNSNASIYDELMLEKVHEQIAKKCEKEPAEVVAKLEKVRAAILSRGLNVHIVCDAAKIPAGQCDPKLWSFATENGFGKAAGLFECPAGESVSPRDPRDQLISVGGSESSFIYQSSLADVTWQAPAMAPTMLLTQYLSQCEGPLWRGVRGDGLAYGANIYCKPDRGLLSLSLYRCAQPFQAYEATKKIVMDVVKGGELVESEFEAAKRSLVFELMQREDTVSTAGKMSVLSMIRQLPLTYTRELCARIWSMSPQEALSVGGPHLSKLFEEYSRAIAVHPSKVNEMKKNFPDCKQVPLKSLAITTA